MTYFPGLPNVLTTYNVYMNKQQIDELNKVRKYCKEMGGVCHSQAYKNEREKLVIECGDCGNVWNPTWSNLKRKNRWCPKCARGKVSKAKLEDISSFVEKNNSRYLGEEMVSGRLHRVIECENGHIFKLAAYYIKKGRWCKFCK
jgi:hypothetical protein